MKLDRRRWIGLGTAGLVGAASSPAGFTQTAGGAVSTASGELKITALRVTPIALPDPPILAASGCHGPYFLRNIIELETDAGIVGIGETHGGEGITAAIERARPLVVGRSAFAYRRFAAEVSKLGRGVYAGIELACLDAVGRTTGRRLCELLGGPVRERVEFASYLFFRYAADHPRVLDDPRRVAGRKEPIDAWGEVRTPEAMADMAQKFHEKWGFRIHKLKAGVLPPDVEADTMAAINDRFNGKHLLRIDPNGRWTENTAVRIGKKFKSLPLEYFEDPVLGQEAMGRVRRETGLAMSTNMCVTSFDHIPEAISAKPIDVVLADHHVWGGIPACQALGTMAETLGWGVSQHSNNHAGVTMAAMVHVGAVVPQLTCAGDTHYPWLVEGADVIRGPNIAIHQGAIQVPPGVGLGVELDHDKLARAHEVYQKCGMRDRDDGATIERIDPGWKKTLF